MKSQSLLLAADYLIFREAELFGVQFSFSDFYSFTGLIPRCLQHSERTSLGADTPQLAAGSFIFFACNEPGNLARHGYLRMQ